MKATNFRTAAGIHHHEMLRDQAEAQQRWSELYAGRPNFGSTEDLDRSRALKETMQLGPAMDPMLASGLAPMPGFGSPAQRIRSSMYFDPRASRTQGDPSF